MAFQLNGKNISIDRPFTAEDGTKYPNLRNAEIRQQLGVIEVADEPSYDQQFYWGVDNPKLLNDREESDEEGNPVFVKVFDPAANEGQGAMVDSDVRLVTKGLKSQWTAQVKNTAGKLLAQTDWMVTRKFERDISIPDDVVAKRAAIVAECDRLETAISAATTVEELKTVVTAQNWG